MDAPETSWLRDAWYRLWAEGGRAIFTLGFSARWEGVRNMPKSGPVLVLANHQSFLDPWLVGIAVKRPVVFLARKTLFVKPWFASFIRGLNAVPIDQEGVAKEGLKTVVEQLQRNKAVLVFPEGSRTPDGAMHPLRPGVHLLIRRTLPPIVPVGIAGAYHAYPIWRKYPILSPLFWPPSERTIAIAVGKPLDPRRFAELPREQSMALLYEEMDKVRRHAEKLRRQ